MERAGLFGQRLDGTEFPLGDQPEPDRGRGRVLVAAAIRDVGDRKRVEAELTVTREGRDRANQAKSRFLARLVMICVSQCRPLSLLNGTLRRYVADPDALQMLAHQEQAIDGMTRLLNTCSTSASSSPGPSSQIRATFALAELFEELRLEFQGVAASKGLTFKVTPLRR